jgi:NtrC-family two-component system response regulator AlgB
VNELQVLVIDDEKNIRATLATCLESLGCTVTAAASAEAARAAVERHRHDLAFLDLRLGETSGLDLLPQLLAAQPRLEVVMITAYGTIESAVEAIQRGARDFLPKPFTPAQIRRIVDRARAEQALRAEVEALRARLHDSPPDLDLATHSSRMRAVLDLVAKAAGHDVPVLLEGENGTGKSALARHIHLQSARRDRPFVVVNCPTLSEELLASELFGHAKGAFTGAVRDQPGRVEAAEGGTLFLDEIGEVPPALQAKLLRFLQDKEYERVGETRTRRADVRILAATNRDLEVDVRAGRFREDLLYRLNTFEVVVPPLRERAEDILPLARRFLVSFSRAAQVPELTPEAEAALTAYAWPGNVRELRNAMERAVILASGRRIGPELLPARIAPHGPARPFVGGDFTLEQLEREHVLAVIARTATLDEAAGILGIDVSSLYRRRKKYEDA